MITDGTPRDIRIICPSDAIFVRQSNNCFNYFIKKLIL